MDIIFSKVHYQCFLKRFALLHLLHSFLVLMHNRLRDAMFGPLLIFCVGAFHVYKAAEHSYHRFYIYITPSIVIFQFMFYFICCFI